MLPPGGMCGIAAWHSQNSAYRLVLNTRSSCSVLMSSMPPGAAIWCAALLTSTSMRPKASTARCTTARQSASSTRSPGTATAVRPASSTSRTVSCPSFSSSGR